MNFLDKLKKLDVDTMTIDEIYEAWGTTEQVFVNEMLQVVQQENQKVKASVDKAAHKAALQRELAKKSEQLIKDIEASLKKKISCKLNKASSVQASHPTATRLLFFVPTKNKHGGTTLKLRVHKPNNQPNTTSVEPSKFAAFHQSFVFVDTGNGIIAKPTKVRAFSSKAKRRSR